MTSSVTVSSFAWTLAENRSAAKADPKTTHTFLRSLYCPPGLNYITVVEFRPALIVKLRDYGNRYSTIPYPTPASSVVCAIWNAMNLPSVETTGFEAFQPS